MILLPLIGSMIIGLIGGFLGQRSRMCFVGGFRDFLLIRDKELLKGLIVSTSVDVSSANSSLNSFIFAPPPLRTILLICSSG